MKMPKPPGARGKLGLMDWLDELYWAWRVTRPVGSEDIDAVETPDGTQLLARSGPGGSGTPLGSRHPFQLILATDENGDPKIRVVASTLGGGRSTDIQVGADPGNKFREGDTPVTLLAIAAGSVYGKITLDEDTGEITAREINVAGELPEDTDTKFHIEIGTCGWVTPETGDGYWVVSNNRYGPIVAEICAGYENKWSVLFS